MKFSIFIILVVTTYPAFSGGYYYGSEIDEYDRETGLYYKAVKSGTKEGGFLSKGNSENSTDINIYNKETEKSSRIFNDNKIRKIIGFIYESQYQQESKSVLFGGADRSRNIKNNTSIENRQLKDRVIIVVSVNDNKFHEIWSSSKTGKNLVKLKLGSLNLLNCLIGK